jgi:hypothetical protein
MQLTGFAAIEFAEKHNLSLNKKGDNVDEYAEGLTVAEAEAIADEDESLIFLNVPDEDYYGAAPSSFELEPLADHDLPPNPARQRSPRTDPALRDGDSAKGNPLESGRAEQSTDNDVGDAAGDDSSA